MIFPGRYNKAEKKWDYELKNVTFVHEKSPLSFETRDAIRGMQASSKSDRPIRRMVYTYRHDRNGFIKAAIMRVFPNVPGSVVYSDLQKVAGEDLGNLVKSFRDCNTYDTIRARVHEHRLSADSKIGNVLNELRQKDEKCH